MKRWIRLTAGLLAVMLLFSACVLEGQCEAVRRGVVRVHILAHSDSEEDQRLKEAVRDAVIKAGAGLLDGVTDTEVAKERLTTALPHLQGVAEECVRENGYTYPVTATLTRMYFATRVYDAGTFPAGLYDAVRIVIGEGKGHNWWCVMYPPLCVAAATDKRTLADTVGQGGAALVGGRYRLAFKAVEWWESLCRFFAPNG